MKGSLSRDRWRRFDRLTSGIRVAAEPDPHLAADDGNGVILLQRF